MKTYYTTIPKKEYPYLLEIIDSFNNGTAICEGYDTDGVSKPSYSFENIRPYTAEEYWQDIATYYNLEQTNSEKIVSEEFLTYLNELIAEHLAIEEELEEKADAEGIDLFDLDSNELWEHDRAGEIAGVLKVLKEVIQNSNDELLMSQDTSPLKR